jgi:two-component system chemotaxis sensor kinase CheA
VNWDREIATKAFREEAYELLSNLETELLELEKIPSDLELVGSIFRALHTLKGTGSMFGFDDIAGLVHEAETVFDLIRDGRLAATKDIIDLSLEMRDRILVKLDDREASNGEGETLDAIADAFKAVLDGVEVEREQLAAVDGHVGECETGAEKATYRIRFSPPSDVFLSGTNVLGLLRELREMGRCTAIARTEKVPPIDEIEPEFCYTHWEIILTTDRSRSDIEGVFIFVEQDSELSIEHICSGGAVDSDEVHEKLTALLAMVADASREDIVDALSGLGLAGGETENGAGAEAGRNGLPSNGRVSESSSSIRVPSEKLDKLVDLVGEMVTVQARLSEASGARADADLQAIAEEVERLTEELRDNTMSLRMVPIGATFKGFRRLVRDLSDELGKEVELTTEGEETELDKKMIEKIGDPLVHIIRNAIDHGIETPSEREAAGKPRKGMLHLAASHAGAYMNIRITDDGAGFDPEAIRRKAVRQGLIEDDVELSEEETNALVFMPGFSTSDDVSNVSGRGVGLDVVKMSVEALKGIVEVESEPGAGTSIILKLPLTLAIIEGLLVTLGEENFVIPLSTVEECVEMDRGDVEKSSGRRMLNVRDEIVPYINLREHFGLAGEPPAIEQVVITRVDQGRVGFVVDNVVGELQTVIKSLGKFYREIEGISGATILGSGRVALIVDVPKLIKSAAREEAERHTR